MAAKLHSATVHRCTACHDGGFLVVVRLERGAKRVAVRSLAQMSEGVRVSVLGEGSAWELAA